MASHELKTLSIHFASIANNLKKFELRKNDRNFQSGDTLYLCEYYPDPDKFSGNIIIVNVLHILYPPLDGLQSGYCLMSLGTPILTSTVVYSVIKANSPCIFVKN